MTSLNNILDPFKRKIQIKYLLLFLFFFACRLFSINAQKNENLFLFNPTEIKNILKKDKNIFNPPIPLKIAKEDLEVLYFLFQKKITEYSFIESALSLNKLSSKFGFLPLVLSAYQNDFVSNLSGKGIWSLNYITALKMNLKVNSYIDQRLNENASTQAAVGYIKELSKLYKSDNWTLLSFITSPNYTSNIIKKTKSNKWEEAIKFIDQKYLFNIDLINWLDQKFRLQLMVMDINHLF